MLMVCLLDPKGLSCQRILLWDSYISLPRLSSLWYKLITTACLQVSVSVLKHKTNETRLFLKKQPASFHPSA
uniref:Uncharacterized protein n=1 Tax=Populus trichocarpa TaxID=3694 RepID=A0A2K2AIH5_POPTR